MSDNNPRPRILIADDDPAATEMLCFLLRKDNDCVAVSSAEEVLEKIRTESFNLIISDIMMGGISGLEMIPQAVEVAPDTIIIIISGRQNIESGVEALQSGAFDYITKPLDIDHIKAVVNRALEHQTLRLAKREAESEKFRLASIVESSDDAIISNSFDGTILSWNKGAERIFGYTLEEAVGQKKNIIFPEEYSAAEDEIFEEIKRGEHIGYYETERMKKDGSLIPISVTVSPIKNTFGEIIGVSKILQDITSKKETERALRQAEERYRAFIEQSSEGIWRFEVKNPFSVNLPVEQQIDKLYSDTHLAECNDAMARQYGFARAEDLIGKRIDDFLVRSDESNKEHLRTFIESNYLLAETETLETDRNGQNKYFLNNLTGVIEGGNLVRIWGTQRDITRTKQSEQAFLESEKQRRQSQKIEAIGRLAGGIAHDFNNFLAVIMLQVDMLNLQLPADSPLLYRVGEIKSVTNNAALMVRQLLAFSRQQPMQPHPMVLNQVIQEFIKILRSLIGENIEVQLNLSDDLGVCLVDHNQIIQVLMNLVVNARDALPKGGLINIETSNIVLSERTVKHQAQPGGSYIQLTVADNGTGMDFNMQEHVFEPFFTTKEIGKGTGLGLATVYGIIKQSNGFIWVESEIDGGTTFKIQFPRIDEISETIQPNIVQIDIPRGNETVLLVEDEEPIRRAAVEVLSALGYQVFEAGNGAQAVQLAELFTNPIHLLITDVVMPGMNGKDLADKIKSIHPETHILLISGYSNDIVSHHGILEKDIQFLEKPFSHQALALKVRETLESY